ncbi:MAG: PQQ-binding-like beta-propeller repeat protein [Candidatus Aenigmatarchaeota archaeon]|nr:PQQ-binding-like beta-propeller repeat protein [Candidatus Aenigmarchaeota archaeon]
MKYILLLLLFLISVAVIVAYKTNAITGYQILPATQYDWPQVQHDPQRTGKANENLGTNFRVVWKYKFHPERVYPQTQAIIYSGRVFVGTESGNLYAFDAANGNVLWVYNAGCPILNSVGVANGNTRTMVYFGCMDGAVYAVGASDGRLVWRNQLSKVGFSTAPVIADNKVMLGGRDGIFYALDLNDGHVIWQYNAGSPILQTAAWSNNKVFFGTMDLYFYALNSNNGQLLWKSNKLTGYIIKDYWPVVVEGNPSYVFVRTTSYTTNFYAFNADTGQQVSTSQLPQEPKIVMNGAMAPPCVIDSTRIVIPALLPGEIYRTGWGTLNLQTWSVNSFGGQGGNQDENMAVSCSQNLVLAMHVQEMNAQFTGAYNLNTGSWIGISPASTFEMSSNTQGGGTNPASISNGMFYHIVYHELIARRG